LLFRLAQVHFRKAQTTDALQIVGMISGKVLPEMEGDIAFLHAQLLMDQGRMTDAIAILTDLRKKLVFLGLPNYKKQTKRLLGFTDYNLGVAHLLTGNKNEGYRQFDLAGQLSSEDETVLAIRDQANLALGEELLNEGAYGPAGLVLDRVRLEGPLSTQALLFAGWDAALQNDCKNALVPWTLLSERESTDSAVQDSLLAVPYCYSKLGLYTKSANLYDRAVEIFDAEVEKLNHSIESIHEGRLLNGLEREDVKRNANWVVELRNLPEMPETFYLLDLMASQSFQAVLKNFLEMKQLLKRIDRWQQDLPAYIELISKRRAHFEPKLPKIDARFRKLELRMKDVHKQRETVGHQLSSMKVAPRPFLLATDQERADLGKIDHLDRLLQPYHVVKTKARIDRLRGLIFWSMYSSFDQRLIAAQANFSRLDSAMKKLSHQYDRYVLIRAATSESFTGYDNLLATLDKRIEGVRGEIESVAKRQGQLLEEMAVNELVKRRKKIREMQVKARFAMADSFDRATMKKASGEGGQ
jgi:tetratricopeptide (TPR) repeat protein